MKSWFKNYTLIDYATQGYVAMVALLLLCFHVPKMAYWTWLCGLHIVLIALIHGLIQYQSARNLGGLVGFLRHYYPIPLYAAFYRETGSLNQMFNEGYLDPIFIRIDQYLFGAQPSLALMEMMPYQVVSEILYFSYFSYYLMIAGVGLALFLRNREQFHHYISVVSFVFYVCFFIYIFNPVMGPRIFFREFIEYRLPVDVTPAFAPDFPPAVRAGLFFQIMAFIYEYFESPGAAFPSSHVAIAICTVYFSHRYLPRIRFVHLVMATLLCISTVYCRYHYAIDVFAGMLAAAILLPVGNRLYFWLQPRLKAETGV